MSTPDSTSHLSIGEVLSLLQDEFPDVTISKIRFLESQGLIDPERTPSGYRKFYEVDISRLQWVLRQQRDSFLPLKVIKSKIESGEDLAERSQQSLFDSPSGSDEADPATSVAGDDVTGSPSSAESKTAPSEAGGSNGKARRSEAKSAQDGGAQDGSSGNAGSGDGTAKTGQQHPESGTSRVAQGATAGRTQASSGSKDERDPGAWLAALQEGGPAEPAEGSINGAEERMSGEELARLADVSVDVIDDLVEFGLLDPIHVGGESMFDSSCVAVVKATREFFDQGVSARHLRIFKNAADREAGFHEQLILPLLKQRNPKARAAAVTRLRKLSKSGAALHKALVQQALRSHFGG